jgi:hypothetical protein
MKDVKPKKNITDFPEKKWVIKGGYTVTSSGKFAPRRNSEDKMFDRTFDF